jgi:hypothetical protein
LNPTPRSGHVSSGNPVLKPGSAHCWKTAIPIHRRSLPRCAEAGQVHKHDVFFGCSDEIDLREKSRIEIGATGVPPKARLPTRWSHAQKGGSMKRSWQKPDWFDRADYYALRIALLILFIAGLVKLIRAELGL